MIKYMHSAMPGAPVLSGTAGAMIGVLDACLVNGFGLKTLDSLVVSGGIATMTIASGHSFEVDSVALVAGATPAGLNGEKRVLSVSTTTATFDATGISNQTATGTISAKLAPFGFAKPFSGTNLAVYRSPDPASTRMFLRVNDTATQNARVVGYESMTDVNTGLGPFPTETQVSGGRWWGKSNIADSSPRPWVVIGDGKTFYLQVYTGTNPNRAGYVATFGDFVSERSGDPYACMLSGFISDTSGSAGTFSDLSQSTGGGGVNTASIPRAYTFFTGAANVSVRSEAFAVSGISGQSSTLGAFPSPVNNGLYLSPCHVMEDGQLFRGRTRGFFMCPQIINTVFETRAKIDGRGDLLGRKLIAARSASPAGTGSNGGVVFYDITGPWI